MYNSFDLSLIFTHSCSIEGFTPFCRSVAPRVQGERMNSTRCSVQEPCVTASACILLSNLNLIFVHSAILGVALKLFLSPHCIAINRLSISSAILLQASSHLQLLRNLFNLISFASVGIAQ